MVLHFMEKVVEFKISLDVDGNLLEGRNNYTLHLPSSIPESRYWSIITYNNRDNLITRNYQPWPSVRSNQTRLMVNEDGSVDAYFGPEVPPGGASNWIQTIPGEKWHLVFRLYEPTENGVDAYWKPGGIQLSE